MRGVPEELITVIPNAVNVDDFPIITSDPDPELMNKWGLIQGEVVGFLGSFYNYEGLDILIDAMPEILKKRPNAKLLFVGGGPCEEALKAQAAKSSAADSIIFAGKVPHQVVNKYYNLIDILVYPRKSLRVTEMVTPLKPLEAMSLGRIFAASSVGGHKELIQDGATGNLFTPDNPQALANKVDDVLSHKENWPDMIKNGRHFAENERTWTNSVHNYKALYERVLKK
jgi:glycosyltransferase involved in cell wall biosynthesis